jgi:hypothetical protein
MNWKLIFQLSIFGLAMAFATLSLVPTRIEPAFWLFILVICAWLIAKHAPGKYFMHGFLVSIVNCVWITAVHAIFYGLYITHHPDMVEMSAKIPFLADHARRQMVVIAPLIGVVSGLIFGLFAFLASLAVKPASVTSKQ